MVVNRVEKALTGAAGEHYVAFRLSALGLAVGLTPRGASAADLLVANLHTHMSVTIQTKTMYKACVGKDKEGVTWWNWRVGTSWERKQPTFYYVFVDLKDDPTQRPDAFIVPSERLVRLGERNLVKYPKKSGPPFTDVWFCPSDKEKDQFFECWELIVSALSAKSEKMR